MPVSVNLSKLAGKSAGVSDIPSLIALIFNVTISVSGAIFLLMLLFGGVTYLTAGGNDESVGKARKMMLNAVIGLLIVLASFAIGTWVISVLTGSSGGGTGIGGATNEGNVWDIDLTAKEGGPVGPPLPGVTVSVTGVQNIDVTDSSGQVTFQVQSNSDSTTRVISAQKSDYRPCQTNGTFSADGPKTIYLVKATSGNTSTTNCDNSSLTVNTQIASGTTATGTGTTGTGGAATGGGTGGAGSASGKTGTTTPTQSGNGTLQDWIGGFKDKIGGLKDKLGGILGDNSQNTGDVTNTPAINPLTGNEIDPKTGYDVNPDTGELFNPFDGNKVDSTTGLEIDPATGNLWDPIAGVYLDPTTYEPIADQALPSADVNLYVVPPDASGYVYEVNDPTQTEDQYSTDSIFPSDSSGVSAPEDYSSSDYTNYDDYLG